MLKQNMYIVDCQSMYYLEDLRQELIKEIKGDIIENSDNEDIVKSGLDLLEKVCSDTWKHNENFIIDELKAFGVNVLKVHNIINDLVGLKEYFHFNNSLNVENDYEIMVNNLINNLKNFFED